MASWSGNVVKAEVKRNWEDQDRNRSIWQYDDDYDEYKE